MILEVQFQNFGAPAHEHQCFHFKKILGAQKLIFFCENWHGASFYNKKQTQKYKFENVLLVGNFENALKKLLTVRNAILAVFGG